jgi:hypothetical protein
LAADIAEEFAGQFLDGILKEAVYAAAENAVGTTKLLGAVARMIETVEKAALAPRRNDGVGLMDPIVAFFWGDDGVSGVLLGMVGDERDEVAVPALRLVDMMCGSSRGTRAVELLVGMPEWAAWGDGKGAENREIARVMRGAALPELARWLALLPDEEGGESAPGSPTARERRRSVSPSPSQPSGLSYIDPTQMVPYPVTDADFAQKEEVKKPEEDGSRSLATYVEETEGRLLWASRPASPGLEDRGESPVDTVGADEVDEAALERAIAALPALGQDPVISLLLSLLSGFYKRTFDFNLAVTGLIHRLATSPYPILYAFFVAGDHLVPEPSSGERPAFLYPLLSDLVNLAEEHKMTVISSKELLAEARRAIAYPPVGVPNAALMKKLGYEENERKKAQWKNVVVIEEVCKEWVALVEVGATSL